MKWTRNAKRWQMQEAKARLSHVVREALAHGPQMITLHGKDVAVVQSVDDFKKLKRGKESDGPSIIEAFLKMPRVPGFKIPERDRNDVIGRRPPLFG
jgi:antitoxin Phd